MQTALLIALVCISAGQALIWWLCMRRWNSRLWELENRLIDLENQRDRTWLSEQVS